ncbi:MAG: hypothetical protein RJB01_59 [Actinomycetota bacterium]
MVSVMSSTSSGDELLAEWELPHDARAAAEARWHIRETLIDWCETADIELVASELVTNAWKHGIGPITFSLRVRDDSVIATVSNISHGTPKRADNSPADLAEHGRGLLLISELAREWGFDRHGDLLNVWAEVGRR